MTFLSYQFLILIFSILSLSQSSPFSTPLLSLNCSTSPSPPNQTFIYNKPIKALLHNLTSGVVRTQPRFITTSEIISGHDRFTGLMQCRLGLDWTTCIHCAQNAVYTISTLCPNSDAITAWFDGCYIQYHHHHHDNSNFSHANRGATNRSCSNRTTAVDPGQFEPALETLLLRLRAEVNVATHHGFSYGELIYGNDSKVYGLVECVRSLSPYECEVCVGKAIEKLHEYCGGKEGGTVVSGYCLARFESYQFYSYVGGGGSDSGGGGSGTASVWESENSGCMLGCKVKVGWVLLWSTVGVAFVVGIALFAWLLKRSIINRAKVITLGAADDDGIVISKGIGG